ncbi:MAG: D-2-hydroxyacid dehydrogenase [Hyphomicrobiales bacterium]|nr:D-2-hydroxyacid dehydrogenase [Hyphomicrobiales bacterium]
MTAKTRIHVKNNRWAEGSFPNTPEGEAVFTITQDRFDDILVRFPALKDKLDVVIDWDEDNFKTSMANADVLLTWDLPMDGLANVAPNLKWIHCIGAGVEHMLPMDWLPAGVQITNNKGVHASKAGEYGLMAVLMLHNHVAQIVTNQRQHKFESLYSTPLAGKTIVIAGTGSLGGAAAQKLALLGPHIIGVNRHGRPVEGCNEVVTISNIDDVLPRADYLYLALPDTPETTGLMDSHRPDLLKPGCGIVNIGREPVMDYAHLCTKLRNGSLAAAILDVFSPEPIAGDSYLWDVPNLIITPHVSADDGDSYVPLTLDLFFRNLEHYLAGTDLLNPVNPELGY